MITLTFIICKAFASVTWSWWWLVGTIFLDNMFLTRIHFTRTKTIEKKI